MGFDFTNRLVYGTYSMLWSVLLIAVFSDMTTVACPAPCECSPSNFCTGTFVNCGNKGFKEVPTGIPKDTCWLSLRGNQISRIDNNTFKGLPQLEYLYLSNNQITRIDNDAFAGLSELRELYLWNNQITRIDNDAFAGLSELRELYLYNNMITSIESIVFEKLPQLQELYVGGNPFQCTCALQSFVEFMQRKGILLQKETWYGTPTCSSPEHLKGKEIINVSYHDMSCDSTSKPAVTLPKTKDDVPTQQIIKTTPRIGDQQTTEPAVTFTKSKVGALTRQTVKTTPRIGDQHTTGKS